MNAKVQEQLGFIFGRRSIRAYSFKGVPQIICKIPLDVKASSVLAELDISNLFDRLIIGPSAYPVAMHQAFISALTDADVTDAEKKVVISNIPIRV